MQTRLTVSMAYPLHFATGMVEVMLAGNTYPHPRDILDKYPVSGQELLARAPWYHTSHELPGQAADRDVRVSGVPARPNPGRCPLIRRLGPLRSVSGRRVVVMA